jgi:LPS O-antigen subunit length determinant protein (WzzB/FepE family)
MSGQIPKGEISWELIERPKEWFNYLLSQWKIIVLAGIIGAAIGVAYSYIKTNLYCNFVFCFRR